MTMSLTRRQFLAASSAATFAPAAMLSGAAVAAESDIELFTLDNYNAAITSGEPFMLAVLSSW